MFEVQISIQAQRFLPTVKHKVKLLRLYKQPSQTKIWFTLWYEKKVLCLRLLQRSKESLVRNTDLSSGESESNTFCSRSESRHKLGNRTVWTCLVTIYRYRLRKFFIHPKFTVSHFSLFLFTTCLKGRSQTYMLSTTEVSKTNRLNTW